MIYMSASSSYKSASRDRGELQPTSNVTRLGAFVLAWADSLAPGCSDVCAKFQQAAKASGPKVRETHAAQASQPDPEAVAAVVVMAAADSKESFWHVHRRGEEVLQTCLEDPTWALNRCQRVMGCV